MMSQIETCDLQYLKISMISPTSYNIQKQQILFFYNTQFTFSSYWKFSSSSLPSKLKIT